MKSCGFSEDQMHRCHAEFERHLKMNIRNSWKNSSVPGKAQNMAAGGILRPRDRCFSRAYFKLRVVEARKVAGAGP
jgi:hypothetical protein